MALTGSKPTDNLSSILHEGGRPYHQKDGSILRGECQAIPIRQTRILGLVSLQARA